MTTKTKNIPYGRQWISKEDISQVVKVLRSDFITQGPVVEKFEQEVADYCGVKFAVSFSSGTAALHGACFAAGIGPGNEVITTPLTFVASANCVLYCDAKPVFADIKADFPLLDPKEIRKKLSTRTKAIIAVDYGGFPADYEQINRIAKANKLVTIADASHSLGGSFKGKKVGCLADMTIFSFHPVKAITTGEGGMVVTDGYNFYQRLKIFRTHGITKDRKLFQKKNSAPWYYEMQELGYNYRLTDIQAALGLSQLKILDLFIKKRREIARRYIQAFKDLPYFDTLSDRSGAAWHLFPILLKKTLIPQKNYIFNFLRKQGIGAQVHYIPVHLHPYYQELYGYQSGDFPKAENFYQREISLPIYPKMTDWQQKRVIEIIRQRKWLK